MPRTKGKKTSRKSRPATPQTIVKLDYAEALIGSSLSPGQVSRQVAERFGVTLSRGNQIRRQALDRLLEHTEPDRERRRTESREQGRRMLQLAIKQKDFKAAEKIWHRLNSIDGVYEQPEQALAGILPVMVVPGMATDVEQWVAAAKKGTKKGSG